jgi:hypothetical protein
MASALMDLTLRAYGGAAAWQAGRTLDARVSASGWAFRLKFQPPDRNIRVRATIGEPRVRYAPANRLGHTAVLEGQSIHLEDASGRTTASRENPRSYFPYGRRAFWWDDLDRSYFSAYALWNYLTFPSLLLRGDIAWSELGGNRLQAIFPASLPTHCARQVFYVAENGLLLRHDYTAEVFGGWARAANQVLAHSSWQGIPYPSHRRVTPVTPGDRPLAHPVLVDITVHEWQLVDAAGEGAH